MSLLQSYELVLLDLNGTFMFGQDRFGSDQDYFQTYRNEGGTALAADQVQDIVDRVVELMTGIGGDPGRFDSFPSVREVLTSFEASAALPLAERDRLEQVIASHELGHVSVRDAATIAALAERHTLALVSNLLSRKDRWLLELDRVGLLQRFDHVVFSSDGSSIKPSPNMFASVLRAWRGDPRAAVMVGDSLSCDIAGARAVGIASAWVSDGAALPEGAPEPTYQIPSIHALLDAG